MKRQKMKDKMNQKDKKKSIEIYNKIRKFKPIAQKNKHQQMPNKKLLKQKL